MRLALLATLTACGDAGTEPVQGIEVTVTGPNTMLGKRYDQFGGIYCFPRLEAIALGPDGAEAEWVSLIVYRGEFGRLPTDGREITGDPLLDVWGSSRIRAGEHLQSQYVDFLIGAPPLVARYVFHYRDLATGETLRTEHQESCTAPA